MRKPNLQAAKQHMKERLRPLIKSVGPRRLDLPLSIWELEARAGRLFLEDNDLPGLLAQYGSPLHVVHARALERNIDAFRGAPEGHHTRCDVFYSYKTNPVPAVLSYLHARGIGAEVISPYELWLALHLGVPPDRIIYNGPAKSDASIKDSIEREILLLNANHREEIDRIADIAQRLGKRARIGIRVATTLGWTGQFGVPIEHGEALAAYRAALARPELDVIGLHSHLGRHIENTALLAAYAREVLDFVDVLQRELRLSLSILDFGGSLEVPTVGDIGILEAGLNRTFLADLTPPNPAQKLSIKGYICTLTDVVTRHFVARGEPVPRICVEPGRALTGNTQLLLARVIETKVDREGLTYAILDAGINLAESVKYDYHQLFPANHYGAPVTTTYRICGPICTPGDVLYPAWDLPLLHRGDSVAIMDAGAYFVPFATSFSFPQPAIVMIEDGKVKLLRRAERFEDMLHLDERSAETRLRQPPDAAGGRNDRAAS